MNIDDAFTEIGHILDEETEDRASTATPFRHRSRTWFVATAAAAAIVVIALAVAVLQGHDGKGNGQLTTSSNPTPTTVATTTAPAPPSTTLPKPADDVHAIRNIDFKNFTYDLSSAHVGNPPLGAVTLHDGSFERGNPGNEGGASVGVRAVVFGDLDDDGIDEAVVQLGTQGDTMLGFADYVFVFTMRSGKPMFVTAQTWGSRAYGGISGVAAHDGALYVDTNSDGPACCPEATEHRRYVVRNGALSGGIFAKQWHTDGKITFAGTPPAEAHVEWQEADPRFPTPAPWFEASAGSRFRLHDMFGNTPRVRLRGPAGTVLEFGPGPDQEITVRTTGRYEFRAVDPAQGGEQTASFWFWMYTPDSPQFSAA